MYKALLMALFVSHLTAYIEDFREEEDDGQFVTDKAKVSALQIRCTRRFSPGVCMDDVKPVWTYNFHLQNCTERLGCRQQSVTNRFTSYRRCMLSCQSLVQLYNHILSQADDSLPYKRQSFLRRNKELGAANEDLKPIRISKADYSESSEEDADSETAYPMDVYDPYVENRLGREDPVKIALEEILPPDLDRLSPSFFHFDPLHRPIQF